MKKIMFLLLFLPALALASGSGGFPSRPRFQEGYINGNAGNMWFGDRDSLKGYMSVGAHWNGANWIADQIAGGEFGFENSAFIIYSNFPLTTGASFTPSPAFSIANQVGNYAVTVYGSVGSNKACASGYTRVGPNYCSKTVNISVLNLTATGCTQSAALPGVTDAKAINVLVAGQITSNNSISARSLTLNSSGTDNTCANIGAGWTWRTQEYVATTAGTVISAGTGNAIVPSNASGQAYFNGVFSLSGPSASIGVNIIGYFD